MIAQAHALDFEVHVWTLMGDQDSPDGLSPEDETRRLYDLGVDAVFADDPAQAVKIRERKASGLFIRTSSELRTD